MNTQWALQVCLASSLFLIRNVGGYPDAYAFAVLLANMVVPLIDYYTRPRTYGHRPRSELK